MTPMGHRFNVEFRSCVNWEDSSADAQSKIFVESHQWDTDSMSSLCRASTGKTTARQTHNLKSSSNQRWDTDSMSSLHCASTVKTTALQMYNLKSSSNRRWDTDSMSNLHRASTGKTTSRQTYNLKSSSSQRWDTDYVQFMFFAVVVEEEGGIYDSKAECCRGFRGL